MMICDLIRKDGWLLSEYTDHDKKEVYLKISHDDRIEGIELELEEDGSCIAFQNLIQRKYNNIKVHITPTVFEDLGYFREFIEAQQVASDFAQEVYKYAVENGYWDL